jgi:hypothetical protein
MRVGEYGGSVRRRASGFGDCTLCCSGPPLLATLDRCHERMLRVEPSAANFELHAIVEIDGVEVKTCPSRSTRYQLWPKSATTLTTAPGSRPSGSG